MQAGNITKDILIELYVNKRVSPDVIAIQFGVSGRTIRNKMRDFGVVAKGPGFLRKGKSATWNVGRLTSQQTREKLSASRKGTPAYNYGFGRIAFTCKNCGVPCFDKPYRKKLVCSSKCKDALASKMRGDKHWNFKADLKSNQRQRLWAESSEFNFEVRAVQGGQCRKCGIGSNTEIHHIHNWADYPNLRFSHDNGSILCKPCHRNFHKKYGIRFTDMQMFNEWLGGTSSGQESGV